MTSAGSPNQHEEYYHDDYYDIVSSSDIHFGNIEEEDANDAVPSGLSAGTNELGKEGEVGELLSAMAGEIETERQKVEIPDYIEAAAEEWLAQYGGHAEEMKGEMDGFFGTMFGEMNSLWSDLADEEADQTMGSPTESDFMNMG